MRDLRGGVRVLDEGVTLAPPPPPPRGGGGGEGAGRGSDVGRARGESGWI